MARGESNPFYKDGVFTGALEWTPVTCVPLARWRGVIAPVSTLHTLLSVTGFQLWLRWSKLGPGSGSGWWPGPARSGGHQTDSHWTQFTFTCSGENRISGPINIQSQRFQRNMEVIRIFLLCSIKRL